MSPPQYAAIAVSVRLNRRPGVLQGDSGGPLMLPVKRHNMEHYEAVGVISSGSGCGSPGSPGIYARVDHFMDWINQTVNEN